MRNTAVVIVLACAVGALLLTRRSSSTYTVIEGQVYAQLDPLRGPLGPIVGATVSNNWDETTATTDSAGRFALRVRRAAPDEFLSLRALTGQKAACGRFAGGAGGHRVLLFADGGPYGSQKCESPRSVF